MTTPAPAGLPAPATSPEPTPRVAPVVQAQQTSNGASGAEAGLIALLALGSLAGAGFVVARSRRKRDEDDVAETTADHMETDRTGIAPAVQLATPERVGEKHPEPVSERFTMPTGQVSTGTEREALLERMIAAAPDEANPFTSWRSRRKRARLILQHRAHLQRTQGAEPFDWRTYRSAKPATATRQTEPSIV